MDSQRFNLTKGDIQGKLLHLSLPIIGTQLMLMGYNLVDMFLLGRVGSDAVAASGSAGMYLWLGGGIMFIGKMGAEIGVAQCKGKGDREEAETFSFNALFTAGSLGLAFTFFCIFMPDLLIRFLNVQEPAVAADASSYLFIVGFGIVPVFLSASVAGTFTGSGNSRAPFFINAFGLALNAILDPIFIFTLEMGVSGAAVATVIAQTLACLLSFHWLLRRKDRPFAEYALLRRPSSEHIRQIMRWAVPVSLEKMLFTFFSMVVMRFVASYGAAALTVGRVGSQIESLCWLVCLGFSSGITTFVGQNFGAGKWLRIWRGLRVSLTILAGWGMFVTLVFLIAGKWLVSLFVPEPRVMEMGASYLFILAFSQIFFCLESVAAGAFRGMGRTTPPSITSIICNALRIPLAYCISRTTLGLDGIWLVISATATTRGLWIFLWYVKDSRTRPTRNTRSLRLPLGYGSKGGDEVPPIQESGFNR